MGHKIYIQDEDRLLIKQMKNGDSSAIEIFVRKYYPDILKYCRRRTSSNEDAMDLTQEVFLRFFSNFSSYTHYGKAKNYLYVIANHICIDSYKKGQDHICFNEDIGIKQKDISIEDRLSLEEEIQKLPGNLKQVIEFYYYQGLKISEISKILQIGIPLVKYRLSQAKRILKKRMEKEK